MSTENDLNEAHKFLARSMGNLSLQLARRKFSLAKINECIRGCEDAAALLKGVVSASSPTTP